MRKAFRNGLLSVMLLTAATANAEVGWQKQVGSTRVKVEFYTPAIVRVVKFPAGQESLDERLVVTAEPEVVNLKKSGNSVSSGQLTVTVNPKTGAISFLSKGKLLLREKNCSFEERQEGPDAGKYRVTQSFTLDKGEAVYGLGTIQNGKMNRRGEHKLMEQPNLEDFQNVLQSVKGWGLFWDNYSRTQFDDDEQGMRFSSEVGRGIDYYFMYGGSADGVIAQMRHLSGQVPMFPLWTFGYWQCKERYKSAAELLGVVDKYRELQVPLDGIIQDWQYWGSNYLWRKEAHAT